MQFIDKSFLDFFKQLRKNNDRDWFNAHKKEYVTSVKEPFENFIGHMIEVLRKEDPKILITPKDAIFRIFRDTRFSKDKTPYKEHASAVISRGGRKDMTSPGVYIQLNDQDARIYSGMYMPAKEQLQAIRDAIAHDPKAFQKLYKAKSFVSKFGEIQGEKNKRLPKDLAEAAESEPLLFNKAFYFYAKLDAKAALKEDFPEMIVDHYRAARPLNDFFNEAINR